MRAAVFEQIGSFPTLRSVADPQATQGQSRIRLAGAALNRRDVWITQGAYPGIRTPIILGSDGAGLTDDGRRVILYPGRDWGDDERCQGPAYTILGLPHEGTLAEQIVVPTDTLCDVPAHLDWPEAAALPLAGLTAWRALVTRGAVQSGDRVLITGIGGGVAVLAAQLAMGHGASVWVTSSKSEKIERAVGMGVKGGARYTEPDWHKDLQKQVPSGFDVIIDGAGGPGFGLLTRLLAPAARLVFYGGTAGKWPALLPQHLFFKQVSILASTMGSPAEFRALCDFVAQHQMVPVVDRIYPLEQVCQAFERMAAGEQFGKIVVQPGS